MVSLAALLLADSRMPTGAYAYSGGLEAATWELPDVEMVPEFIRDQLRTTIRCSIAATFLSYDLAQAYEKRGDANAVIGLAAVQQVLEATMPARAQRQVQERLGRSLLRSLEFLLPDHPVVQRCRAELRLPQRAIVMGAAGVALGATREDIGSVVCYDEVQSVAAAALKLLPVDPFVATRWVLSATDEMAEAVEAVRTIHDIDDFPVFSAPRLEHWILVHNESAQRRLFIG